MKLVLETATHYLVVLANQKLDEGDRNLVNSCGEGPERDEIWKRLLAAEDVRPDTYLRLHSVLESAWDMLDAMTTRIVFLGARAAR